VPDNGQAAGHNPSPFIR